MSDIDAHLREIIADLVQGEIPPFGDLHFESLPGWDSIAQLHLLMDVEQTFGVTIPDDTAMDLDTLARLHDYIAAHGGEAADDA